MSYVLPRPLCAALSAPRNLLREPTPTGIRRDTLARQRMRRSNRETKHMGARSKTARMALVLLVLLVAGVLASSGYQAFATTRDLEKYPAPGQLIDVGGYRMHIHCVGGGNPTVLMEAGRSGCAKDRLLAQAEVTQVSRTCAYDRAGYGWSEEGPKPQDSQQEATALNSLLSRAGIDGEIVLVGDSLGGVFDQYYARTYPQQ